MRGSLFIVAVLFAVAVVVGLGAPPEEGRARLDDLGQLIAPVAEWGPLAILALIIVNNVLTTFVFFLLGVLVSIPPLVFVGFNGYILGAVAAAVVPEVGVAVVVASLAPHGIIEIPAALLAAALGVRLGFEVVLRLVGRPSAVRARLRSGVGTYVRWVLPALLIAAVVEVFATPLVVDAIANGVEAAA